MIKSCLLGLSLSIVVVTIAGYLNANQQAQDVRALHRGMDAFRRSTASKFAETRHAAKSAGRDLARRMEAQNGRLAATQKQLAVSLELIANLKKQLRTTQVSHNKELDACRRELAAATHRTDSRVGELKSFSDELAIRLDEFGRQIVPLRHEVSSIESTLSRRIEHERIARENLAQSCQAVLAAEGKMLDSYCYALRAMAESRKVRAVVEQELAAEAELEADLLTKLADDAQSELGRLAELTPNAGDQSARIAQVPADRIPAKEPILPQLIDAASGQEPQVEAAVE